MNKYLLLALVLIASTFVQAQSTQGGQFKELGAWQVHYIAFPSTFIQPNIARSYDLERSNYKAVVNISVLKNNTEKTAQQATLTGEARNLIGNKQTLTFKEVVDGESVYYLAQIDFDNEEIYRFTINIQQGNTQQVLKFQQKFYVD
ncbi:hypothetical protein PSECIP111951_00835 [Pseudoalteromonas holothuriae]|uniref:DUF4426 domain-containing protein n=1 Tax=Pseudoalteromonas holothuriae TaxID=2963714 RepID=A0A9W4QWM8_9GAMM|nr:MULTISPECIES: DUF4426 domain-containing protein [unclassified Pseudoalteromonas]CAH9053502.1 hypothetical protein PSECIP111951_00835 [Pseudoalteromonas sp. CIP111951]CAH9056034.1 hypothetical protein PSECIP111854_01709 [Pseudoalteromonas sp. CIP111854]